MLDYILLNRNMQLKGDNLKEWQNLGNILNDMVGARKTAEQWRRVSVKDTSVVCGLQKLCINKINTFFLRNRAL